MVTYRKTLTSPKRSLFLESNSTTARNSLEISLFTLFWVNETNTYTRCQRTVLKEKGSVKGQGIQGIHVQWHMIGKYSKQRLSQSCKKERPQDSLGLIHNSILTYNLVRMSGLASSQNLIFTFMNQSFMVELGAKNASEANSFFFM